jgi:hypothetical protein
MIERKGTQSHDIGILRSPVFPVGIHEVKLQLQAIEVRIAAAEDRLDAMEVELAALRRRRRRWWK